jgi:DNA-directed RNA polymerase specialized sigma subunit
MLKRLTDERRKLVEENLNLVDFALHTYCGRNDYEDLYGAGCLGLCRAAAKWEAALPFEDLALIYIADEIKAYLNTQ